MSYKSEILHYQSDYIRLERAAEIAACADAQIAELEIDAARYRWLRDKWYLSPNENRCLDECLGIHPLVPPPASGFDSAVDKAMAAGEGNDDASK